jgi:hypothetical protein
MSTTDNAFRSRRPLAKDLSAPHLRALRKELLIVRAEVERMELAQATLELRNAVTHFSWLKFVVPGFGGRGGSATRGIGSLLKAYPVLSSVVSLILAKPIRAGVVAGAKPVLKWGSLALAAWEAYRVWQQIRRETGTTSSTGAGGGSASR